MQSYYNNNNNNRFNLYSAFHVLKALYIGEVDGARDSE